VDLNEMTSQLNELEAALPQMVADNPDPADFWPEFAGVADCLEGQAGEHSDLFWARINTMLAKHGRYIAYADSVEECGT